ncbi:MFS transporter [Brevibacillus reuszeri]|uniref:MFS transporter n=1 Tax=Brevibacillus reuszeri TaxID=54915 RepID=UPI001B1E1C39|nr:MFS transporter [Brevibacillus reuszeri]GIO08776.1 MFS transporter [Brevibacillus reuszeri]
MIDPHQDGEIRDISARQKNLSHSELAIETTHSAFSFTRFLTILFATACGMAVATIYFAHPLLDSIASDIGISHSSVGIVITVTQICYALGLFFLVPLGDLLNRRHLIMTHMILMIFALIGVGFSSSSYMLFASLAVVGLLAVVTQTLVSYAASLSEESHRGSVVGFVTSGVVIGILLARSFAGIVTDLAGWRSVYLASALLTVAISILLYLKLPSDEHKKESLSYQQLLTSTLVLFAKERILRIRAVLALLIFMVFSILWTSLVLPLHAAPFSLSHTTIGAFGLAGVAGAIAAARAGQLADRGLGQKTTGIALLLLLLSWWPIYSLEYSLWALGAGIILLDLAVQAVHVTNQSLIFAVRPEARSRLTASYMIFYSIGSASGSIASTTVYGYAGWYGVCLLGASVSAVALLFWGLTLREPRQKASI